MNYLVTPDHLINLAQITYVERHDAQPTHHVTVHFSGEGSSAPLKLQGASADMLIERLTRPKGLQPDADGP